MKKLTFALIVLCIFFGDPLATNAKGNSITKSHHGKFLLQVESYGRMWYVNPADGKRYYLKDGNEAMALVRRLGTGISNTDITKIPTTALGPSNPKLVSRFTGRFLIQTKSHGEAWYVNPADGLRYYLKDGDAAMTLFRSLAVGARNADLRKIPMNTAQLVQDTTFDDVAYVRLRGNTMIASKYPNQILSPASMGKLMTALVLLDQPGLNWNSTTTITQEQLDYPKTLAGDSGTSEVDLHAGDVIALNDLWVAMLVASSNQATIALVDASGLTRAKFIAAMNASAKRLGLKRTIFYDPTGLDAHSVTTPAEMAVIAKTAFSKQKILNAQKNQYTITTNQANIRTISVTDRNYSLQQFGAEAAKVGFLVEAQRCVALKRGNDIIVVMHARSMPERNAILKKLTR